MRKIFVILVFLLFPSIWVMGAGQDTVIITKALALKSGSFYRTTFFSVDPVERMLVTGTWVPPGGGRR